MRTIHSRFLPRSLLGLFLAAAGAFHGCGSDGEDIPADRTGPSGIPLIDGGRPIDEDELCPDSRPKSGESCARRFPEEKLCRFENDPCTRNGVMYDSWVEYCCVKGLWELCGSLSRCDEITPDPEDAGTADAPRD